MVIQRKDFIVKGGGMKRNAWIILGYLALMTAAHAASFDCNKTATKTEKMVCASQALSRSDDELADVYKKALDNRTDIAKRESLMVEQRLWLSNIRNACRDEDCLVEAYRIRIIYLSGLNAGREEENSAETFELVMEPRKVEKIKKDFQDRIDLREINIHLQDCPFILTTPWGRGEVNVGLCHYGSKPNTKLTMLLCSESMVGYFEISLSPSWDLLRAKNFAKANCLKGG